MTKYSDLLSAPRPKATADIAIVVGGAPSAPEEFEEYAALCRQLGKTYEVFAVNDRIADFPFADHAVTLHPPKLQTMESWYEKRKQRGLPMPREVWAHRPDPKINVITQVIQQYWRGSSGLFAVQAARLCGYTRIILCGVPMRAEAGHYLRPGQWHAVRVFLAPWIQRKQELQQYVRSASGLTAELLGKPDSFFIESVFIESEPRPKEKPLSPRGIIGIINRLSPA